MSEERLDESSTKASGVDFSQQTETTIVVLEDSSHVTSTVDDFGCQESKDEIDVHETGTQCEVDSATIAVTSSFLEVDQQDVEEQYGEDMESAEELSEKAARMAKLQSISESVTNCATWHDWVCEESGMMTEEAEFEEIVAETAEVDHAALGYARLQIALSTRIYTLFFKERSRFIYVNGTLALHTSNFLVYGGSNV